MQNLNYLLKEMYMNQYNISTLPLPAEMPRFSKPPALKSPGFEGFNPPPSSIPDLSVSDVRKENLNFLLILAGIGIGVLTVYLIAQSLRNNEENRKRRQY